MKLLQASEDARANRRSLKPQVERRRRERMNRSLERLKALVIQQQEASPRRVEKAEILEHTVLFLQNSSERNQARADSGGGGQQQSFRDGFSTCLRRAAHFLGPEGKGLWLGAALDASLAARSSHSDSAGARRRAAASRSGYRLRMPARDTVQQSGQTSGGPQSCATSTPQQARKGTSQASKQSPPVGQSGSRSMWRPWP
uniref:BHLH domain-containing protein n=1 Tax=Gasterosteus aculeatus TaxID=69293 RepID=G3PI62_GASAC